MEIFLDDICVIVRKIILIRCFPNYELVTRTLNGIDELENSRLARGSCLY
jgi:hypothetical protein